MPTRSCTVGSITVASNTPLTIIGGPCVLESLDLGLSIGRVLRDACRQHGLQYVFKASYDKANRSSITSPRGPGLEQGLAWIAQIRETLAVPATTDIHEPAHTMPAAKVVDLLQIPAFLCRQTDLLVAAGLAAKQHNRAVNVKKGQFLAPHEMAQPVKKLVQAGCTNIMLTERGTTFGYGRLVNDFLGMGDMMELKSIALTPPAVCFDATHSTQLPGAGDQTGGRPERAPLLARAAVAAGVDAIFLECHPSPKTAMSDASTMLELEMVPRLIEQLARIRKAL
jgi:2-dehydro-3-deoxyphosphooctonate aldolase (KDO 8-P synthase)